MLSFWLHFAIFPTILFLLAAAMVTGLPLAQEMLDHRVHEGAGGRDASQAHTEELKAVAAGQGR